MMNYYQPFLFPFIGTSQHKTSDGISSHYYLSFEDCFWSLLTSQKIKKNSYILFPSFYCMDVVNNTRLHGYRIAFYPTNEHFQTKESALKKYIHTYNPSVVIVFHACGITHSLMKNSVLIKEISKNILIVEDSVHQLVNPEKVEIYSKNHVRIDSLRKVSPLPGSIIYGHKETINLLKKVPVYPEGTYIIRTILYYVLFRLILNIGFIFKSSSIITFAHKNILKKHDDLIGDNQYGHLGLPFISLIHQHINFEKIEKKKNEQVQLYIKTLMSLKLEDPWYFIDISSKDYKNLHVYPLGLKVTDKTILEKIENTLKENRMPIWFKFTDSPWSKEQSVLFLPLGFHILNDEIVRVCKVLQSIQLH